MNWVPTKLQQDVIDRLREGWIMAYRPWPSGRAWLYHEGSTIRVKGATFGSLLNRNVIKAEERKGLRVEYRLTDDWAKGR